MFGFSDLDLGRWWSSCLRCEGHFTVILAPVVGARPIKTCPLPLDSENVTFRAPWSTCFFQVTAILDAVAAVLRGVGSGVDHGLNAVCCCDELFRDFAPSVRTRVVTLRVVFFSCSSFELVFFSVKGRGVGFFAVRTQSSCASVFTVVRRETSSAMKSGSVLIYSHFVFGKRSCCENLLVRWS